MEGISQPEQYSVAARAFGGVTLRAEGDAALMFQNPGSLLRLAGLEISVAGFHRQQNLRQVQEFAPVRYYPNLSLLLENRTAGIPDPDPDLIGFTPADSVQRPFDDIQPRWTHSRNANLPLHAVAAMPFSLGSVEMAAGAGYVRYADLNHYYQNNNVLDPTILSQRPLPILRPTDNNPLSVDWFQSSRSREGVIHGYGLALTGVVAPVNLTLGISALLLSGSSDDVEQRVERGLLTFLANEFRADSISGQVTHIGSSSYSGQEITLSAQLGNQYADLALVANVPSTIKRSFDLTVTGDSMGQSISGSLSGEEELRLPWRGSASLLLKPREKLRLGLAYELRPYAKATVVQGNDEREPWVSSNLFRVGVEYDAARWVSIRGGIRGEADVFAPEGTALDSDAVSYRVFSAGLGVRYAGIRWDVTYEYGAMRYSDVWASAVSRNSDRRHTIVTGIAYTIPVRP